MVDQVLQRTCRQGGELSLQRPLLCERVGVLAIDRKRYSVTIKFTGQAPIGAKRLVSFLAQSWDAQFPPEGALKFQYKVHAAGGPVIARSMAFCTS
jgi:hypothetical protein